MWILTLRIPRYGIGVPLGEVFRSCDVGCMHVRLDCNANVCGGHYDDSRVISTMPRVTRYT